MIKLLILDVDGVMTDGTKIYDREGKAIAKGFCDLDFTAIGLFRSRGWRVCFLSSDKFNQGMARRRHIDFYYSRRPDGKINKTEWLSTLHDHYGVDYRHMVYIGDDVTDMDIMETLIKEGGTAFCPLNAATLLQRQFNILNGTGGHGVVMTLYDLLYEDNCNLR